jgi:hypothetical protein
MIFQLIASILMIITLEIYHAYTIGDPDRITINNALENKDIAVVLLYISRFLSGWSAGKHDNYFQSRTFSVEKYGNMYLSFQRNETIL